MKQEGDERSVKRFAILPVKTTDNRLIWFKRYVKHQKCVKFFYTEEVDIGPWFLNLCTHEYRWKLVWKTLSKN